MTAATQRAGVKPSEAEQTIDNAWRSAIACHRGGHLPQAEELYVAIINAVPAHTDALYNLGILRAQLQRYDESLQSLAAAIDAAPTAGDYWLSYIEVLALSGKREQAREVLAQAQTYGLSGARVAQLKSELA